VRDGEWGTRTKIRNDGEFEASLSTVLNNKSQKWQIFIFQPQPLLNSPDKAPDEMELSELS
jgi:hypothetical protein